jgi:substrate import-associated zinc metallohydrolase lipoprotein
VASLGFTSPYASSETREDFAETVANYITKTDAQWAQILDWASKNWTLKESSTNVYVEGGESDGVDGKAVILQKVSIVRQWFKDSWGVDLDSLRSVVQYRQSHFNIDSLRNEVYSIKK